MNMEQAAARLRVWTFTIKRKIKNGSLKATMGKNATGHEMWEISEEALQEYIDSFNPKQ